VPTHTLFPICLSRNKWGKNPCIKQFLIKDFPHADPENLATNPSGQVVAFRFVSAAHVNRELRLNMAKSLSKRCLFGWEWGCR